MLKIFTDPANRTYIPIRTCDRVPPQWFQKYRSETRLIKNWNWINLTFVISYSKIAPKEYDMVIESDDRFIEGGTVSPNF